MANIHLGYLLHVLVEVPAAISFFLFPSGQLGAHTPHAHAVIRQYALLLLSSALIALVCDWRQPDEAGGQIAGALSLYHVGPVVRSASRIWRNIGRSGSTGRGFSPLAEPALYLILHIVTGFLLARTCWTAYLSPPPLLVPKGANLVD